MSDLKPVKLYDICILEKGQQIDTSLLDDSKPYRYINGGIKESGYYDDFNTSGESVLISEGGASCGYINYVNENFWCGCHCYRLHDIKVFPKYLFHALKANQQRIMALRTGSAMPNIQKSTIQKFELKIHDDINTQKKVSSMLDKCNELIEKHKLTLEKYDSLIKSRFIEMFGDPVQNPMGWEVYTVEECATKEPNSLKAGPFGSSLKKEFYVETGYKIYGQEQVISGDVNFGDYYIDEKKFNELKSCEVKANDVLISLVGTYGKLLIIPQEFQKGIINPRLLKITFDKSKIDTVFFKYFFASDSLQKKLTDNTHGGTMGILNLGIVRKIKIPVPPISLQNEFSTFVHQIDKSKFEYKSTGVAA